MVIRCFIPLLLTSFVVAIPVDNGVEGDPEIECGATSITINFNTQATFEGHVYVKVGIIIDVFHIPFCSS